MIKKLFMNSYEILKTSICIAKDAHKTHAPSQGELIEKKWLGILMNYLPERYRVSNGFVIDSESKISKQIDILIYDKQYSQFVFTDEGHHYIPIEAIYAIFECKTKLGKKEYDDAISKIESVKILKKTYTKVKHINGITESSPNRILYGVLAESSVYTKKIIEVIKDLKNQEMFDLFVILDKGLKCERYDIDNKSKTCVIDESNPLFAFIYLLNDQLQTLGTVGAMNYYDYYKKNK
jgi:hypothetical protein